MKKCFLATLVATAIFAGFGTGLAWMPADMTPVFSGVPGVQEAISNNAAEGNIVYNDITDGDKVAGIRMDTYERAGSGAGVSFIPEPGVRAPYDITAENRNDVTTTPDISLIGNDGTPVISIRGFDHLQSAGIVHIDGVYDPVAVAGADIRHQGTDSAQLTTNGVRTNSHHTLTASSGTKVSGNPANYRASAAGSGNIHREISVDTGQIQISSTTDLSTLTSSSR